MKRWTDPLYWITVGTLVLILAIVVAWAASAVPLPAEDLIHLDAYHHRLELESLADLNGPYRQEVMPHERHLQPSSSQPSTTRVSAPPLAPAELRALVKAHFRSEWVDEALAVAWCESRYVPTAANPRSSARGLWQFLRGTWNRVSGYTGAPSYDSGGVFDPTWQAVNASWLVEDYTRRGLWRWAAWTCSP